MWLFEDKSKAAGKAASKKDCCAIQQDLNTLGEWSLSNHLPLSIDKCAYLHYGHKNLSHTYKINGVTIKSVYQISDLIVLRTYNFLYNTLIDMICLNVSRLSTMVVKLFAFNDHEFLTLVYQTYIHPCLEYASMVWSPIYAGTSDGENSTTVDAKAIR